MEDQNLLELVRQSKNGDAQALEKLVASCQPAAFRLALSILDDPSEADDVAQDAFIKAIRGISTYREQASFTTWLYRIIVNDCLGKLRRRRARQRLGRLLTNLFFQSAKDDMPPEKQATAAQLTVLCPDVAQCAQSRFFSPVGIRVQVKHRGNEASVISSVTATVLPDPT